jgi:hypothetical protein
MTFHRNLWTLAVALTFGAACSSQDTNSLLGGGASSGGTPPPGATADGGGGDAGGGPGGPPPGGALPDEQFPPDLLKPYTGPPNTDYENTFVTYLQLKSRVVQLFADTGLGGGTDAYFTSKIALLGGADFKTTFSEARVASPDFLVALDGIAKEACGRAATNKTGPFAGTNPSAPAGGDNALATTLFQKLLLRSPSAQEVSDGVALVTTLKPLSTDAPSAWAGLCEGLVRHPDFLFTLPPSVSVVTGADKERMQLVKLALDLAGRLPVDAEFASLAGKSIVDKVTFYLGTPEFKDFYFHRTQVRTESVGTTESAEPARLWTYLMLNGAPMQEVLTADYTIDASFNKITRGPEHGKSGVLTMPGFIKTKPGLPHYNYAARVMTDYMGQLFEITPEILKGRVNATASSTVQPGSLCITCHGILTPLEYQRLKWADDGTYRTVDATGKAIDDSDNNLVPDYPYKGSGMEAFATTAVRKEKFFRQTFQAQYLFFLGRQMRFDQDERTVYLALWNTAWNKNGDLREVVKVIASSVPGYLGN